MVSGRCRVSGARFADQDKMFLAAAEGQSQEVEQSRSQGVEESISRDSTFTADLDRLPGAVFYCSTSRLLDFSTLRGTNRECR
jgi:hypothetical protein